MGRRRGKNLIVLNMPCRFDFVELELKMFHFLNKIITAFVIFAHKRD